MIFRSHPVTIEARGWDGAFNAGLDLVTWVRSNGGQAHLNSSYGRTNIVLWHTAGEQQTMKPERDYLVRTVADGRFHVVARAEIDAAYEEAGADHVLRNRPLVVEGRDWDGSLPAGLDLVTWVRTHGGQAHLDTRSGARPTIVVGAPPKQDVMVPGLDLLLYDPAAQRFAVRDRRVVEAEFEGGPVVTS